jgi:RNA polymerase sigma factor (sigma-70 family)
VQEDGLVSDARLGADERELSARALHGDEEALGRLLALYQGWAYNLAYRVLGHEADARDAVQEAFLTTVRTLRGDGSPPRSADSFKPWLRRVVSNAAVTQIRRRNGVHALSVDDVEESLPGPSSVEPGPAAEQIELRGQVLQVLLGLPETQRVALALREYLGASYDEIAETLDLPRTAIGTLLFRARAAFRSSYERVAESAPPIDCPDLVPLFASIIDGEPQPGDWMTLEAHLKGCEACSGELESQRRARRMYGILPLLALPAGWEPIKSALAGAAVAGSGAASVAPAGMAAPSAASAPVGASIAPMGTSVSAAASATPAAASLPVAASATPVAVSGGLASSSGLAGLFAGLSGAKVTLAALATATLVGAGVAAGQFGGLGAATDAAPSPVTALVASPTPITAASPGAGAAPIAVVASPDGSPSAIASPGVAAPSPSAVTVASPSPAASLGLGSSPPPVASPSPAADNGARPPVRGVSPLAAAPIAPLTADLVALASPAPVVASPMPTDTLTPIASATPTVTPSPTPTASATPTPSPTASPTRTASSTPLPSSAMSVTPPASGTPTTSAPAAPSPTP